MLLIPEEEIIKRFRKLPEKLKTALNSPTTFKIVDNICQANYLKKEWVENVAMITAEVLLGFLDSDNVSNELQEITGLNYQHALAVAKEIDRKIFAGLKDEIEKVYSPLPQAKETKEKTEAENISATINLRQKEEIKPPIPESKTQKEEIKPPILESKTPPPEPQKPIATTSLKNKEIESATILFKPEMPIAAQVVPKKTRKPFLGGWFRTSTKKEGKPEKIAAQIETLYSSTMTEKPKVAKTEAPTFKVVHYTQFAPSKKETTDKEGPKIIFGQKSPMPTAPVPPAPSTFQPKNIPVKIEPPPPKTPIVPTKPMLPVTGESSPLTPPVEENKKTSSPALPIKEIKAPSPSTLTSKSEEEKEMIDLETLQKVKIKVEEEKKPKANNGNVINLRGSI